MIKILKKIFGGGPSVNYMELAENGAVIIDVRTSGEFSSGHIKSSINIPLDTISRQLNKIKKFNKPVITVCRSGSRSGMATGILKKQGIEAYNGGAWNTLQRKIS
jgi:rhodanese-related sulfurtransferase